MTDKIKKPDENELADLAELFKVFLKTNGIEYYPSECYGNIYFSLYETPEDTIKVEAFLNAL